MTTTPNAAESSVTASATGLLPVVSRNSVLFLRTVCTAGLAISACLAWTAWQMTPLIGCGEGGLVDCSHVLNSSWSKVWGVPVSVPAVGLYTTLLGLLMFARQPAPPAFQRILWTTLSCGFFTAAAAAIWFIGLQVFVLKHICPWCMAAHSCGLLLAGSLLFKKITIPDQRRLATSLSVAAAAALITVQSNTEVEPTFEVEIPEWLDQSTGPLVADPTSDFSDEFSAPGTQAATLAAPGGDSSAPAAAFAAPGQETPANAAEFAAPGQNADQPPAQTDADDALFTAPISFVPPCNHQLALPDLFRAVSGTTVAISPRQLLVLNSLAYLNTADEQPSGNPPPALKRVTVAGSAQPISLIVDHWPGLGSRDADFYFVELFDYTCPHCRDAHESIKAILKEFDGRVGVLTLPVPLERFCNPATTSTSGHEGSCELSRIAIAVWRCDPAAFPDFHEWLFNNRPTIQGALAKASTLVDPGMLQAELATNVPAQYIQRHVELYRQVGAGSVPKLLFSRSTVKGAIPRRQLSSMIRKELKAVAPQGQPQR